MARVSSVKGLHILLILVAFMPAIGGYPQDFVSGKLALEEGNVELGLDYSPENGVSLGSCLVVTTPEITPAFSGINLESKNVSAFFGSGELQNGWSLKKKPYGRICPDTASLWSPSESVAGNSLLFGFKSGDLAFVAAGEKGKAIEGRSGSAIDAEIHSSLRFAGFGYKRSIDLFSGSFSGHVASLPESPPGDGWRPGKTSEMEETLLGIAAASKYSHGGFGFGLWAAGSAGYFAIPGAACSAELEAKGNLPGGGGLPKNFSYTANIFSFAANPTYRTVLGEIPLYDFLADVSASIRVRALSLSARAAVYSLSRSQGSEDGTHLLNLGVGAFERQLWSWRNDLIKAGLDIAFSHYALAARLSADQSGMKTATIALRGEGTLKWPFPATVALSAKAAFSRNGLEDTGEEESDDTFDVEDEASISESEAGVVEDRLGFSALTAGCRLAWKGEGKTRWLGKGVVAFALSGKKNVDNYAFFASAEISQALILGKRLTASLTVKTPEGGYVLGESPAEIPSLAIGFTLRKSQSAR